MTNGDKLELALAQAIDSNEQTYDDDDFEDADDEDKAVTSFGGNNGTKDNIGKTEAEKMQILGGKELQKLSPVRTIAEQDAQASPAHSLAQALVERALDDSLGAGEAKGAVEEASATIKKEAKAKAKREEEVRKAKEEAERKKIEARERMKEEIRMQLMNEMEAEDSQNSIDLSLEDDAE